MTSPHQIYQPFVPFSGLCRTPLIGPEPSVPSAIPNFVPASGFCGSTPAHSQIVCSRRILMMLQMHNARLTEQIFDGGFYASVCTKGDSGNLSGAAVCYALDSKMTNMPYVT